jgi:hypothetical protein
MGRRLRRALVFSAPVALLIAWPAVAQIPLLGPLVVHDPAVTLRNSITATIQQLLFGIQQDERQQIERMARRLTAVTSLGKYAIDETPEWRIHDFWSDDVLFAHDYHAALNYGDRRGSAYTNTSEPVLPVDATTGLVDAAGWREFQARLATVNAADAVAIAATNDAGLLRYNGRQEQAAIEALQAQVIDPSQEQSTTAVLQKINGAALVADRQRQARTQFVAGILEQLLIDTKRARDTEATALNMQLTTWREAKQTNNALASGTGDALRAWRQP